MKENYFVYAEHVRAYRRAVRLHILIGIPDFEWRTPNNRYIVQGELFKFTERYPETIGYDCRGINDNQPFLVKLWLQMDRAQDRATGFKNIRSFAYKFDYASDDISRIKAFENNKRLRNAHGRKLQYPRKSKSTDEEYEYHYGAMPSYTEIAFIDRLMMGDVKAGEELRTMEDGEI